MRRSVVVIQFLFLFFAGSSSIAVQKKSLPMNTKGRKTCDYYLGGALQEGQEFGPEKADKIIEAMKARVLMRQIFTDKEVEIFLTSGWPALLKLAHESETTPEQFASDFFDLLLFSMEMKQDKSNELKQIKFAKESIKNLLVWLQSKNLAKLKGDDQRYLQTILFYLSSVALNAMEAQIEVFNVSDLNPLLPLNEKQVQKMFYTIEAIGEEAVLVQYEKIEQAKKAKAAAAEKVTQVHEQKKEEPDLKGLPSLQVAAPKASEKPLPLADLIESGQFIEGQVYEFENFQGHSFTIEFDPEIAKASAHGEKRTISKLLSSLYVGNGHSSGLKLLTGTIRGLMEVKATTRGHKRLLGCIEGRHVVIKKFSDMPMSIAGYNRVIPHHFCE